jgi:hypothetical protein
MTLSCTQSEYELIKIDPLAFQERHIGLSDIADDITYIPLDRSCYISHINEIKFTDSLIYLSSMSKNDGGIYAYTWQGFLINRLEGLHGNGPGECTYYSDFTVDRSKERIYIVDAMQKEIEVYSMKDKHVKTISLKDKVIGFPSDIAFWNSNLILGYSGSEEYCWAIIDTLGNLVDKKKNALYPYKCNVGLLGGFFKFGDNINFWDPFNDTIFSISHDWEYKAIYLFERGDDWVPPFLNDITRFPSLFKIYNLFETKRFIYVHFGYKQNSGVGLYDKINKNTFNITGRGITNTIDGGVDFRKCIAYFEKDSKEYLVMEVFPFELKAHVSSDAFKNSNPKYPEKKRELEQLANSLSENDNPVLMIVKLKE